MALAAPWPPRQRVSSALGGWLVQVPAEVFQVRSVSPHGPGLPASERGGQQIGPEVRRRPLALANAGTIGGAGAGGVSNGAYSLRADKVHEAHDRPPSVSSGH